MDQKAIIIGGGIIFLILIVYVVWYMASEAKAKRLRQEEYSERQRQIKIEEAKKEAERRKAVIEKYGDELGNSILNERFFLGMTKEQLKDSKGRNPDKIEREELKTKVKETWIYGNKNSGDVFVFENDVLTKIKDR